MYSIVVEGTFCATHRLRLADGTHEPLHGHDWKVRAFFRRQTLDDLGLVVDFHEAQARLGDVLAELHQKDLNTAAGFTTCNPTAEVVARTILERLRARGLPTLFRVEVTEAPGCVAVFEADEETGLPVD